ncbi:MAG TPA: hypothetical protein V6C84_30775 [Coleofasciculaceae cyanobacterium]|jgi:hypothetical protein
MSDPSQSKGNPDNEAQASAEEPGAEEPEELNAEELDELSGGLLIYRTTGTSTGSVSTTPPPPPPANPPPATSPGAY